jgi:hypothetical protein
MNDRLSVALTIDDRNVTLEGPRDFVEQEVRRLTDMLTPKAAGISLPQPNANGEMAVSGSTEREFVDRKAPNGHMETVAVLAFYLTEQGHQEFSEEDIRRAYIRAGVRPPKVVAQALRDAKNKKDFIQQGSTRGTYRLTHHGDRFVRFDLGENQN